MTMSELIAATHRRLAGQWAQPVLRSGYVLVLNSVVTAVLGVGFWLLAARLYRPEVVGVNTPAISAMMFLAGVAQLNLMSSLLRFVPTAGRAGGRLVGLAYLVGAGLSAAAAGVFLAGLASWTPGLVPLLGQAPLAASFVLACAGWSVLVMQGSVLVALGRPGTATLTNQIFNVLKLVLLLPLAVLSATSGVWLAWITAMLVAVAAGFWFVFHRPGLAWPDNPGEDLSGPPSWRELVRFAGPDYVGALAWIACTTLVPILVLNLTDAEHAAVFALTWSICLVLYGIPTALGQALVVHGVRQPSRLREQHARVLWTSLGLLAPVVAVLVSFAPRVLAPFGSWYAAQGSGTLRLLALSTMPNAVVALTVSRARVDRRMSTVVATMVSLCVIVLGLTWLLVPRLGIVGGAGAWVVGQVAVATGTVAARGRSRTG
jgi:O-antigen/teichoic acid export membrane protein